MKFDVYCDESRPDLLSSVSPKANYMVLGSLWLKAENREKFKKEIHSLRNKHKIGGEFKWQKVSPSKEEFYTELIEWFFNKKEELRFRCIAIDHKDVNLKLHHENDQELGFYKFYYQLLHHWILDCNEYSIFLDYKSNRRRERLPVLKEYIAFSNLSAQIKNVQAIKSNESVLIQVVDVLTGIASAKLNRIITPGSSKDGITKHIEKLLGEQIMGTPRAEQKFNVFLIDLRGGW